MYTGVDGDDANRWRKNQLRTHAEEWKKINDGVQHVRFPGEIAARGTPVLNADGRAALCAAYPEFGSLCLAVDLLLEKQTAAATSQVPAITDGSVSNRPKRRAEAMEDGEDDVVRKSDLTAFLKQVCDTVQAQRIEFAPTIPAITESDESEEDLILFQEMGVLGLKFTESRCREINRVARLLYYLRHGQHMCRKMHTSAFGPAERMRYALVTQFLQRDRPIVRMAIAIVYDKYDRTCTDNADFTAVMQTRP